MSCKNWDRWLNDWTTQPVILDYKYSIIILFCTHQHAQFWNNTQIVWIHLLYLNIYLTLWIHCSYETKYPYACIKLIAAAACFFCIFNCYILYLYGCILVLYLMVIYYNCIVAVAPATRHLSGFYWGPTDPESKSPSDWDPIWLRPGEAVNQRSTTHTHIYLFTALLRWREPTEGGCYVTRRSMFEQAGSGRHGLLTMGTARVKKYDLTQMNKLLQERVDIWLWPCLKPLTTLHILLCCLKSECANLVPYTVHYL